MREALHISELPPRHPSSWTSEKHITDSELRRWWSSLQTLKETRQMYLAHLEDWYEGRLDVFMGVLSVGRRLSVTKDQDRIYGFLGMAPDILRDMIRVQYATPIANTYRDIAPLLSKPSKSLAILSQTELRRGGIPAPNASPMQRGGHFTSVLPS